MSVVLDTSAILAAYDRADPGHEAVAELLRALDDELVTTPLVAAQMDRALAGTKGRDALWKDLDSGAITVRWWASASAPTSPTASSSASMPSALGACAAR